ncbi:MAG: hypothetical protein RL377_88, partial [Bacteroidota bacterium]
KGFYQISQAIKDQLDADAFVNTVTIGDIFKVDLNKQTIFPLSHIMINSAAYNGSTFNYSISVLCMDIVDESKEATADIFLGNDNEQDVLNTQQMVATRLLEMLRRGDLFDDGYQLQDGASIEYFVDRFENKIAGVTVTMNVIAQNDMTIC